MDILGMIDTPNFLLWAVVLSTLVYWYLTRTFNYWKSKGVPYAKPYPVIGSMGSFIIKPFHTEEVKRYKKFGRIYGGFEGSLPYLSIGEPQLLKDVLVKDFIYFPDRRDMQTGDDVIDNMVSTMIGEDWKRVRSILTPVFTTGKLKKLYTIVNDNSKTLCEHFMAEAKRRLPVDVTKLFGAFTMDVIISSAFGTKVDSFNDKSNRLVQMGKIMFRQSWRFFVFFLFPSLMKKLHVAAFSTEASAYFKNFTLQVIKERRQTGKTRDDFLQMLLDAANENDDQNDLEKKPGVTNGTKNGLKSRSISLDELVSQCVIFLAAGYDTTATTLSFVAFNLALNPDCQEKLIKEIDSAYEKQGQIDYATIQEMQYLDSVISETLRLYPALIRSERRCAQDYRLGDTGITITKHMMIGIPIYAMHHDPEFYPEPEKFRPERFFPENKANIVPYTYQPFGVGPRNCIGMRFALMEMKICLVNLLRHFRFKKCSQTKIPGDFIPGNLLIAPKEITLRVEIRNDAPAA